MSDQRSQKLQDVKEYYSRETQIISSVQIVTSTQQRIKNGVFFPKSKLVRDQKLMVFEVVINMFV